MGAAFAVSNRDLSVRHEGAINQGVKVSSEQLSIQFGSYPSGGRRQRLRRRLGDNGHFGWFSNRAGRNASES